MTNGIHFQLQTPFTVKGHADREHCTPDDLSRFFNSHDNHKLQQKQSQIPLNTEEKPKGEKLKSMIEYANYVMTNDK